MGRPGMGSHSSSGGSHSGRVSGSGHSMSSHGGRGGSGSHTRPGVGSGSSGHIGSGFGHSSGNSHPAPGNNHFGHTSHPAPGNNHYGHTSHPGHYGHGYVGTTWHGGHLGHTAPPPPPPHHHHYGGYSHHHYGYSNRYGRRYGSGYGYGGASRCSCVSLLVAMILVIGFIVLVNTLLGKVGSSSGGHVNSPSVTTNNSVANAGIDVSSNKQRERLETDSAYNQDCIEDRVGWFDNESAAENELKEFWELTGVEPYILIKEYDASLTTEAQKEEWAISYYENNLPSDTFLYVYFDEDYNSAGYDDTVGFMYVASTDMVKSVMDTEAVQIFWDYLDYYWALEYLSTDDVFIKAFNSTASVIMNVQSSDPGVAIAQAQAEAANEAVLAAQAQAAAAQAEAEAKAEAAAHRTKVLKTVLTVILIVVGVVILVLGGLAIASLVIYSRSQKKSSDEQMINTPLSKEEVYGSVPNSTSNSAFRKAMEEKELEKSSLNNSENNSENNSQKSID